MTEDGFEHGPDVRVLVFLKEHVAVLELFLAEAKDRLLLAQFGRFFGVFVALIKVLLEK